MKHMLSVENEFYKELSSKYDPQGIYKKKYADIAEKEGINLEWKFFYYFSCSWF